MAEPTTALWQKIQTYALTAPGSQISFEEKLALDNGWTHGFAMRVTAEYRKFLYLTQVAGRMVCPSDEVDQAWHLHLTQTSAYAAFCSSVLGGFLHHHASQGGPRELQRHQDMYRFTLDAYEKVFDQLPDPALWPSVKDRFFLFPESGSPLEANWRLTAFVFQHGTAVFFMVLLVGAFIGVALGGAGWPKAMGPLFLLGYVLAIILVCAMPTLLGKKRPLTLVHKALDPYELAYLEGGSARVFGVAVASLVDLGALVLKPERAKDKPDITGAVCEKAASFDWARLPQLHPIEQQVLRQWPEQANDKQAAAASEALASQMGGLQLRLVRAGMAQLPQHINVLRGISVVLLLVLALAASMRFASGLVLQHPVVLLGLLLLATLVAIRVQLAADARTTRLGAAVLNALKTEYAELAHTAAQARVRHQRSATDTGTLLALGFALFGSQAVMASEDFAGINWIVGADNNTGNSNSAAGCGGGGCGGGCGGCGG